jgi:hypothetical protein
MVNYQTQALSGDTEDDRYSIGIYGLVNDALLSNLKIGKRRN